MRHRHVFSCAFPHVPVHPPRPCAAKVTLPDSSKVHPPNVLLPTPSIFACNQKLERESAGAPGRRGEREQEARRPGVGSDQPAPLALPQNQLPTQHPPSSSVLQQFHTCKRHHHQTLRNSTVHAQLVPSFPVRLLATLASLQAPTPVSPYLSSTLASAFFSQAILHTHTHTHKNRFEKTNVMAIADAHFYRNTLTLCTLFVCNNMSDTPSCERILENC